MEKCDNGSRPVSKTGDWCKSIFGFESQFLRMEKEKLERVVGISRYYERMWIERDKDGKIKQVYDVRYNPIEKHMLYRSFVTRNQENGFYYEGEFIKLENAREFAKKRAVGYQRKNKGHSFENVL